MQRVHVRTGDSVVQSFTPRAWVQLWAWLLFGPAAVAGAVFLGIGVVQAAAGSSNAATAFITLGAMLLVLCGPTAVAFWRLGNLAPVLTTTQLLRPGWFYGWTAVGLADVTGVGLRCWEHQAQMEWVCEVWLTGGRTRVVVPGVQQFGLPDGVRIARGRLSDDEEKHAWQQLSMSYQGWIATAIAEQVTALQGSDGLLATHAAQITGTSVYNLAYWSPDGRIGPVRKSDPGFSDAGW